MSRTACLWVPHFELKARMVAEPALEGQAVILADVGSIRAVVLDASAEARRCGICTGMSMIHARALCPDACLIPPDPAFVRMISDAIRESLYTLGPVVGGDGRQAFFVSLDGMNRLHPDEEVFARRLGDIARDQGLPCIVAIADRPLTAWVAAHADSSRLDQVVVVPTGDDRTYLGTLPVAALPMPGEVAELCRMLGIEAVADLQCLPHGALTRRFGRVGADLERRARAETADLFRIEIPQTIEHCELELDNPLEDVEPLLFLHKSVLDRLLCKVAGVRRNVAALEVTLVLADVVVDAQQPGVVTRTFRPTRPTLDTRVFLELLLLWLSEGALPGPVIAIEMRAPEVSVATPRQLRLFEQQEDYSQQALSAAISRLAAAFGPGTVVRPVLADTLRPEARIRWEPLDEAPAASPSKKDAVPRKRLLGQIAAPALQLFDPPMPVDVQTLGVVEMDGPYPTEGEWWDRGFRRDYFLVTTRDAGLLWLYRAGDDRFFLHGYLD